MALAVRAISAERHLEYVRSRPSVSFLQTPAWGEVKRDWSHESLGWFDGEQLVGAGLLLLRKVPRVRRFLAYLPEGPDLDWERHGTAALAALATYCRTRGVFQVKIGPHVWVRRWDSDTLKQAVTGGQAVAFAELAPTQTNPAAQAVLRDVKAAGWRQESHGGAFGDFQPRYVFALDIGGKSNDDLLAGFNQLWRRNIRKAEREGVTVRLGDYDDLPLFHECYRETATRDQFTPRPLQYFQTMWRAMHNEDAGRIALFIAEHPDHRGAIAATTLVQVGDRAWYSYGASTTAARDLRPSNAVQWAMMQHARDHGAQVYDMRGIADTLDPEHHLFGLIQFKLGTGGYAQEYAGEWDLTLSRFWAAALRIYLTRR